MKAARPIAAALSFLVLIATLWLAARHTPAALALGPMFGRAFLSFVLLFAPLWFSGFGLAERLKTLPGRVRILGAAAFALPYFVFASGTSALAWPAGLIVIALPVLLAAFLGTPELPSRMTWRDAAALTIIGAGYFLKWLQPAWPLPALVLLPKLFLADVAFYCFLVIRRLEGAGNNLVPTRSALSVGMREWAFYVPIALLFGEGTGFIHFHAVLPAAGKAIAATLSTLCLIAFPEELFFRAILQNFLETRLGRNAALVIAALLFGFAHFNHGATFNGRYVLLASIAGYFYGRAWRAHRQILAAVLTHTGVDVVWSLWFR